MSILHLPRHRKIFLLPVDAFGLPFISTWIRNCIYVVLGHRKQERGTPGCLNSSIGGKKTVQLATNFCALHYKENQT